LLIISAIFYVVRKRMILYLVLCGSAIAAFILMSSRYAGSPSERVLIIYGLGLYSFGLTVVRVILNRSISLNLLASLRDGLSDNTVKEEITGRLKDAQHYRLVSVVNETYYLSWFGWIFALLITIAYHVFRIEK
jgi:hypothetical protein